MGQMDWRVAAVAPAAAEAVAVAAHNRPAVDNNTGLEPAGARKGPSTGGRHLALVET